MANNKELGGGKMKENGKITRTWLGCYEGHWFLELTIEFGACMVQHRISLYEPKKIIELFEMLEVDDYDKINGSYIRVETVGTETYGIGNIIKDKWIRW